MANLEFRKVTAVPSNPADSNTIYIVKEPANSYYQMIVTDSSGNHVKEKNTSGDIVAGTGVSITGNLSSGNTTFSADFSNISFSDLSETDASYDEKVGYLPVITGDFNSGTGEFDNEKLELVAPINLNRQSSVSLYLWSPTGSFNSINYVQNSIVKRQILGAGLFSYSIRLATVGDIDVGTASGGLQIRDSGGVLTGMQVYSNIQVNTDSSYSLYNSIIASASNKQNSDRINLYTTSEPDIGARTAFTVADLKTDAGAGNLANFMTLNIIYSQF